MQESFTAGNTDARWLHRWKAAILPSNAIGTHTGVHDIGKAPPGYRRVGSLSKSRSDKLPITNLQSAHFIV